MTCSPGSKEFHEDILVVPEEPGEWGGAGLWPCREGLLLDIAVMYCMVAMVTVILLCVWLVKWV